MNPNYLKKIRLRIREMRNLGLVAKEAKTRPAKLTIGMSIVLDDEFEGHGYLSFYENCLMIYPLNGDDLIALLGEMRRCEENEFYPHLADYWDEYNDSGDIWKKDESGEWLISDEEITRRHKILDGIAVRYFKK